MSFCFPHVHLIKVIKVVISKKKKQNASMLLWKFMLISGSLVGEDVQQEKRIHHIYHSPSLSPLNIKMAASIILCRKYICLFYMESNNLQRKTVFHIFLSSGCENV